MWQKKWIPRSKGSNGLWGVVQTSLVRGRGDLIFSSNKSLLSYDSRLLKTRWTRNDGNFPIFPAVFCYTIFRIFRKELSTLSLPKSSSIEKVHSNGSLPRTEDEFDVFAKSVAFQLRKMDIESAMVAQNKIQNVLTEQRIQSRTVRLEEFSEFRNRLTNTHVWKDT